MYYAISAHIKLVERYDIFGKVILYAVIRAEFAFYGFFRGEQIRNLNIQLFIAFFADEIDLSLAGFANRDFVSSAQQLQKNDILKNQIDVAHIAAIDSLAKTVVGDAIPQL
jgi:hypothetical protein